MAKFCGHCGVRLEKSDKVCGNCGTPVEAMLLFDEPVSKKKKTVLLKIFPAVLILLTVAMAIRIYVGVSGYRGLLKDVMSDYKDYDIEDLAEEASGVYFFGRDPGSAERYFEYVVGLGLDSLENNVGPNYRFTYKVNGYYELSNPEYNSLLESISGANPSFDPGIIDRLVAADVTATAKGSSQICNLKFNVIMSRENSKWKVLYIKY